MIRQVAGAIVFISLDELLPTAAEYGEGHLAIYGLIAGMALMALSLLLFLYELSGVSRERRAWYINDLRVMI